MDTNSEKNNEQQPKETGIKENAINKKEVDGRDINQQQEQRKDIHQPRDNA